jgi:hypothetical protein
MTAADPVSAPLEANDPRRAKTLKAKIRDRVSDERRHLLALRTAMAEFGDDFDLDAFSVDYMSEDPVELNRVKVVERGVDQLYNYIAELVAFGLELAELRGRRDETNARRDLDALRGSVAFADGLDAKDTIGTLRSRPVVARTSSSGSLATALKPPPGSTKVISGRFILRRISTRLTPRGAKPMISELTAVSPEVASDLTAIKRPFCTSALVAH